MNKNNLTKRRIYKFVFYICIHFIIVSQIKAQNNFSSFQEVPLSGIKPEGWMHNLLIAQKNGLTGHISLAGEPFNLEGWGYAKEKKMKYWSQYEQNAYWADGALRCGYLINDDSLKSKVENWIFYQINNAAPDGFIGPKDIKNLWPEVVFFRAMMAEYSATRNKKILDALAKNYRSAPYENLFGNQHQDFDERKILHIEIMCWLYQQTGDDFFIKKAEDVYNKFCLVKGPFTLESLASDQIPRTHSVSYCENIKIPVILYICTGHRKYLDAAINGMKKIYKYYGLVDGLVSGNEGHDGNFSNEVHETCTVSDMQWSLGYFLEATGNVEWADMIEKICFNAGLGSVAKDFSSYQYYSGPNQVIADSISSFWNDQASFYPSSRDRSAYTIDHRPACCGGNMNRILPIFCSRMWMKSKENAIVASLYAPSQFNTTISNQKISIKEETNYPFEGSISFLFNMQDAVNCVFKLRIPGWCTNATIRINGKIYNAKCLPATFVSIKRIFSPGDRVEVNLPMEPKIIKLPYNGIAICRGPLIYSLPVKSKIKAKNMKVINDIAFGTIYQTPASKWNYALLPDKGVSIDNTHDFSDPWNLNKTPISIRIKAQAIKNWQLYRGVYTPVLPAVMDKDKTESIRLVPLGCTELRLSIFPDGRESGYVATPPANISINK